MYLLFDIGGTHTRVAIAKNEKSLGTPVVENTPTTFEDLLKLIEQVVKKTKTKELVSVSGGCAGKISDDGSVISSVNLSQFSGKPFASVLKKHLGVPVIIRNDAVMAAVGECRYGAGKGSNISAFIVVGTGIGGARCVNGRVDDYKLSFEPGKQIIDIKPNGDFETLESLASGKALEARFGKKPSDITDMSIWGKEAKLLAVGIHNTIIYWTPDTVILGGGVILTTRLALSSIKKELGVIHRTYPSLPKIVKASLGDFAGLYGALATAVERK